MAYTLPTRFKEVDLNFGSTPTVDKSFTIVDVDIETSDIVVVLPSGKPSTNRQAGDFLVDAIQFSAVPGVGELTIYALCTNGHITGHRKVVYIY